MGRSTERKLFLVKGGPPVLDSGVRAKWHCPSIHEAGRLHLDVNCDALTLTMSCEGEQPQAGPVELVEEDFFGRPRPAEAVAAGPFGTLGPLEQVDIDPREDSPG